MYLIYNKIAVIVSIGLVILFLINCGIIYLTRGRDETTSIIEVSKNNILCKRTKIILFILLALIYILTRLYDLTGLPEGLHADEAGMAYNAYCLANYGVDRYLDSYPIVLGNFDASQSALYTYFLAVLFKIFGFNISLIRIPSVLFGAITCIFGYLITKELLGEKWAFFTELLLIILPYFIMSQRIGLDCNLCLPIFMMAVYFVIRAIKSQNTGDFIIAGFCTGLTFYAYGLAYLEIFLFVIFGFLYLLWTRKLTFKTAASFGIPVFLLGLPHILSIMVNMDLISPITIGPVSIQRLSRFRVNEISISNIFSNFTNLKVLVSNDGLSYNSIKEYGTVFYASIIFLILGLLKGLFQFAKSLIHREYNLEAVIDFMLISVIFVVMCVEVNINRANAVYFAFVYFIVCGIQMICSWKRPLFSAFVVMYCIYGIFFTMYYFEDYNEDTYPQIYFNEEIYECMPFVTELAENHTRNIYIDSYYTNAAHIYTVIYELMSPYDFIPAADKDNYMNYWNYYFTFPDEIDYNGIYLARVLGGFDYNMLKENGFSCIMEIGNYKIYVNTDIE